MKPYIVIKGTERALEEFETQVSQALEQGYELSTDLMTQVVLTPQGSQELVFIQPMVFEELLDYTEEEMEFSEQMVQQ